MCIKHIQRSATPGWRDQRGVTLVELIVFIVIVSTALAGTLSVLNMTSAHSADPMIQKQMLAIAEALIEEVTLQPFTVCNGDDDHVKTATSATVDAADPLKCATNAGVQGFGHSIAARGSFSNIGHYCAVAALGTNQVTCPAMTGAGWGLGDGTAAGTVADLTGVGTSPAGYFATIALTPQALTAAGVGAVPTSGAPAGAADASALNVIRVTVTVGNATTSDTVVLESYRTRWARNIL